MNVQGLHHGTAVTANASGNVAFYIAVLGLRLVKKMVNQNDVAADHLCNADAVGHAGTDLTVFDWACSAPQQRGAGKIATTAFQVPGRAARDHRAQRLDEHGVAHGAR